MKVHKIKMYLKVKVRNIHSMSMLKYIKYKAWNMKGAPWRMFHIIRSSWNLSMKIHKLFQIQSLLDIVNLQLSNLNRMDFWSDQQSLYVWIISRTRKGKPFIPVVTGESMETYGRTRSYTTHIITLEVMVIIPEMTGIFYTINIIF